MKAFAYEEFGGSGSLHDLPTPEPGKGQLRIRVAGAGLNPFDVAVGATGGVGSYLVQLAARRGARVIAVCRSANGDYARGLGAAEVVDHEPGDVVEAVRALAPGGIDGIADMHGDAEQIARLAEQLRPGGHVASAVGAADVDALKPRGIEAVNVQGRVSTGALDWLAGLLTAGEIQYPEIQTFQLADTGAAFDRLATGHVRGKLLVL